MTKKSVVLRGLLPVQGSGDGNRSVRNQILLGLPPKESAELSAKLELVEMQTHGVLNEISEPVRFGYFINTGLASILNVLSDGKSVEVGLTGKEGFVGLPLAVGLISSPTRAVTQVAGSAFQIRAGDLLQILPSCPRLANQLNRYSQELAVQSVQVAACNRLHEVEERLARWLLMVQDRIGSDVVPLTHEFLAHMLGTRRASVTVAAGILQKAGLITYTRGTLKVVNRTELEEAACECYEAIVRQSRKWANESN